MIESDWKGRVIHAGMNGSIKGKLSLGPRAGAFTSQVALLFGNKITLVQSIEAESYPTFSVEPNVLKFERVAMDAPAETAPMAAVFRSESVHISGVPTSDASGIGVDLGACSPNGEQLINVRLRPELLKYGRSYCQIHVPVDDLNVNSTTIAVLVDAVQSIRPVPSHVFLRPSEAQSIQFVAIDGAFCKVRAVNCKCNGIEVTRSTEDKVVVRRTSGHAASTECDIWATMADGTRVRVPITRMVD